MSAAVQDTAIGDAVVARCRELATISQDRGRLTRAYATPAMARANALVGRWMREAGLLVRTDAAGNLVGHRGGSDPHAGTLLLGSHLDTVRDAGAFDGPLGVVVAIAALEQAVAQGIDLPFAVDVYGFADEEGLRYGTAYLGSRAVAGTFDETLFSITDDAGVELGDALREFGGSPEALRTASRAGERILGYCEVHMEQGPVLEGLDAPAGVVTAVSGATRAQVRFVGRPGHAGTVPMDHRRDALCAAAEWILVVEETARSVPGLLATVGVMEAGPGAANVVPGSAQGMLDVRHSEDPQRAAAVAKLRRRAEVIAAARGCEVEWRERLDNPAVAVDPRLTQALTGAALAAGLPEVPRLPSGAGHDAVALADLCGVAMLFVRCAGGLSHDPGESVRADDAGLAVAVLARFLGAVAAGDAA